MGLRGRLFRSKTFHSHTHARTHARTHACMHAHTLYISDRQTVTPVVTSLNRINPDQTTHLHGLPLRLNILIHHRVIQKACFNSRISIIRSYSARIFRVNTLSPVPVEQQGSAKPQPDSKSHLQVSINSGILRFREQSVFSFFLPSFFLCLFVSFFLK